MRNVAATVIHKAVILESVILETVILDRREGNLYFLFYTCVGDPYSSKCVDVLQQNIYNDSRIAVGEMLCKLIRICFSSHCTKSLIQEAEYFSR